MKLCVAGALRNDVAKCKIYGVNVRKIVRNEHKSFKKTMNREGKPRVESTTIFNRILTVCS